jgi:hypothetical protein
MQTITVSQGINGDGPFMVSVNGLTLTLPLWAATGPGKKVTVKDVTGATNPNITVVATNGGTIDGQSSVVLSQAYESLTFVPYTNGNNWIIT